jgi:mycothiol synthase
MTPDEFCVPEPPTLTGLGFRRFRGPGDFPAMAGLLGAQKRADGVGEVVTVDDLARFYAHLRNCTPAQDMAMAEINGELVGYSRVTWWDEEATDVRIYSHFGKVHPAWRHRGIGGALCRWSVQRLREIVADQDTNRARFLESSALDSDPGAAALLDKLGYQRYSEEADMVRDDLEEIPEAALPAGLEVRPVRSEDMTAIWEADHEAFRDHPGYSEAMEDVYQSFLDDPHNDLGLWQVAWDGDQIAGQVRPYIDPDENEEHGYLRGHTESVSVRRPWRRRGLARALLVESLRALAEREMTSAAISVYMQNPRGALDLYRSVGFRVERVTTNYRKPLD